MAGIAQKDRTFQTIHRTRPLRTQTPPRPGPRPGGAGARWSVVGSRRQLPSDSSSPVRGGAGAPWLGPPVVAVIGVREDALPQADVFRREPSGNATLVRA